ncbi:hypothetical protein [Morganella morganii]|uniref:hypothetical protein n=1 Tax=Morganella morganii TaxID=582 RepID=UPI00280C4C90|nr:hypothetical protein [Morganella morganii]HDU8430986.1 hypothetical protein [Morganella morganii]
MNKNEAINDIDDLLVNAFNRDFWLNVKEHFEQGYLAADAVSKGSSLKLENPEQIRFRPQARHYGLNSAFRRAATSAGLICRDMQTNPKGEGYVVVESGGIQLGRIGLNHDEKTIRSAKHRNLLAQLNKELEGYTFDLFDVKNQSVQSVETLGVLLVNVNPPHHYPQDDMLDLRVVVPYTTLKGYHYNKSINELLELYTGENKTIIPDLVLPKLKKRLKDQEK